MTFFDPYSPLLTAPLHPMRLQYLIFFVTDRCNARCSMCFNPPPDGAKAADELTIDEIEKIARGMTGLVQLTISGGEPFLRDDLPEIVGAFVRESGTRFVTLPTNAFAPDKIISATERMVAENPSARFNFCVSIDDVGERHDAIRGKRGGFERLLETCRETTKLARRFDNLEIHTTTVISAMNASRMEEILDWVAENIDVDVPEVLLVRGSPRNPATAHVELPVYERAVEKIEAMSGRIAARKGLKMKLITSLTALMSQKLLESVREDRMTTPCVACRKLAILRPDGTVDPCEILDSLVPERDRPPGLESFAVGNLRRADYRFDAIMRSEKATRIRRFIRDTRCHCTFECAIFANFIFQPSLWPSVGMRFLKDWVWR